jgi:2-amino-4-hydroxy-6-hydroxymethyldihydropteridine diphosphokinase
MATQKHLVYIALGTNLGDRSANLKAAIHALMDKVTILATSPAYQTPPWGVVDQPFFLNQVVQGETDIYPLELLRFLKQVETRLGRVESIRYGPRLIDLDILFFNDLILEMPELTIPHPQLERRGFVLFPLADLAPNLYHPVNGKTIKQLLDNWLDENDSSGIELFVEN